MLAYHLWMRFSNYNVMAFEKDPTDQHYRFTYEKLDITDIANVFDFIVFKKVATAVTHGVRSISTIRTYCRRGCRRTYSTFTPR